MDEKKSHIIMPNVNNQYYNKMHLNLIISIFLIIFLACSFPKIEKEKV